MQRKMAAADEVVGKERFRHVPLKVVPDEPVSRPSSCKLKALGLRSDADRQECLVNSLQLLTSPNRPDVLQLPAQHLKHRLAFGVLLRGSTHHDDLPCSAPGQRSIDEAGALLDAQTWHTVSPSTLY